MLCRSTRAGVGYAFSRTDGWMDRVAWKELALLGFTGTLSARRAKNNECNLISRSTSCAQAASARHRNISCIIAKDCPPAALSRALSAARSAKLIGIDPKSLSDDTEPMSVL